MNSADTETLTETVFTPGDLEYDLPESLIAQHPPRRRDDARLLVVHRSSGMLRDARIIDLPELLRPGDLLVLNNTRVIPAGFEAVRRTGGVVPGLFLSEDRRGSWRVMLEGSRRLRVGERLAIESEGFETVTLELAASEGEGRWKVNVEPLNPADEILSRIGKTPLPPYITRKDTTEDTRTDDRSRYQTVYARRPGAVAAPTAGLHFTEALLDQLHETGIETCFVTLHIGIGTFRPIKADSFQTHVMHAERYELPIAATVALDDCRERGGRIVAVGTTTVRVLESAVGESNPRTGETKRGQTDLFIYPPYRFRNVDVLLTNFHLPRSTLLALVMAFGGVPNVRRAYGHAVRQRYRFFSYGDAMCLI